MSPADRAAARVDFRIKFSLLRQAWGDRLVIPEPDYEGDLDILYAVYERYLRQVYINRNANDYTVYIIILFIVIEFFGTKVLGLPLTGYTINQLSMMNRYERLLIELGEKNYGSMGSGWPVEIRIILLSLFNAFVFLLVTSLCANMGPEVVNLVQQWFLDLMNGRRNNNPPPPAPAPDNPPSGGGTVWSSTSPGPSGGWWRFQYIIDSKWTQWSPWWWRKSPSQSWC